MSAHDEAAQEGTHPSLLLQGARAGHPRAWARLFDLYAGRLRAELAARIPVELRSRFDAEDLVQAAFLKAYRNINRCQDRGERSFEVWLRRIARCLLVDRIRHHLSEGRDPVCEDQEAKYLWRAEPRAKGPSPLSQLLAEEESSRLRAALAKLPELDRTVLRLRCEEQRTWRNISSIVQHTVQTARRHLSCGLENLRREIG